MTFQLAYGTLSPENQRLCPLKRGHFKRGSSSEPTIIFFLEYVSFEGGKLSFAVFTKLRN